MILFCGKISNEVIMMNHMEVFMQWVFFHVCHHHVWQYIIEKIVIVCVCVYIYVYIMYLNITSCHVSLQKQINSCGYISLTNWIIWISSIHLGLICFYSLTFLLFFALDVLLLGLLHITCSFIFFKV
jgi:hypothetical protein